MSRRVLLAVLALASAALATRMWTEDEIESFNSSYQAEWLPRPESLQYGPRRFNYLRQIKLTCDFVASYQVSDSLSGDFGGIIEAEHMPTIIETDNTQEAIWIWSRWYELTGRDDYQVNIQRAWTYVMNHPAYCEHGGVPSQTWYAIWNCGLGFMAEAEYRRAYGDSSHLAYADTCRSFYLANPLPTSALDYFVTSQSSGMAMDYARTRSDAVLHDSALARGQRVKSWIEGGAANRLGTQNWAMCGGTAFWGVVHTVGKEDTAAGKLWVQTYGESLPGFYPGGSWNCSHNIWLANAYRSAAELGHDTLNWVMHHYLTDTLLMRDTDDDGGIPATWSDPVTQDQTWVSTYLVFMGMDVFVTPTYDDDLSLLEFTSPDPLDIHVVGVPLDVIVPAANVGRDATDPTLAILRFEGVPVDTFAVDSVPFLQTDTIVFYGGVPQTGGMFHFSVNVSGDDNPLNDTARLTLRVYDTCRVTGTLVDSTSGAGIVSWVKARLGSRTSVWDSVRTDTSGRFSLKLIDSIFSLSIEPSVPYYARSWSFAIRGDTTIDLRTQPAHVLIVNNDTLERYASYYTSTLDTLGVTWCQWNRPSGGLLPYTVLDRLRTNTVIWYSGNTSSGTIPVPDRDSLARYAQTGTNLFITGQNIAQELSGTAFLESICGCRFDSSGWSGFFAFGNRQDSLGAIVTGTATTGGNGASNQTSRDVISPLGNSSGFILYDSVNVRYASTRRQIPAGGRVVFMGLGFEAVNRPGSKPGFFSRVQLLRLILDWFGVPTGVEERQMPTAERQALAATVVRGCLVLPSSAFGDRRSELVDASGRRVMQLRTGANDLGRLPAGVYFVRTDWADRTNRSYRVLLVR
ncbi:hypothetical protein FJY68_02895 [candidate division WOR-3 bacterium]|uniref:Carboxypeptidase regulatory-like domain-containing protein n=1 Tax=candidate division WOR-3 bacterium TaxID=2052148 RepID=A0A937XEE7_UNCW3|nr:hypothetical protein [candidate division WOR-3 bacterium]